jgi:RNA polymerase sigma-70 factor (ECF subfamily)
MDARHRFEAEVLPHLDAAYNLARWLVRDEHAAEDMVQEAFLRAFRYFGGFRGGDARPWLLGIVRNCCHSFFVQQKRQRELEEPAGDSDAPQLDASLEPLTPETLLARKLERAEVNAAVAALPWVFREVLVLREVEELSYEEIARLVGVPTGTVMSRLSRARSRLQQLLGDMQ